MDFASGFPPVDKVIIGYSGGKDSLVLMDLAIESGRQVSPFFMYFIPGLDYTAYWVNYAETRWRVKVRLYPHFELSRLLRYGTFRMCEAPDTPLIKIGDIERKVRADTGLEWIGYGYKKLDSLERRGMMQSWANGLCEKRKVFSPIKDWTHNDVKVYLARRRIEIPKFDLSTTNGISLEPAHMQWVRENWPTDYQRILEVFPLAFNQADRAAPIREQQRRERLARQEQARALRRARGAAESSQSVAGKPSGDKRLRAEVAQEKPAEVRTGGAAGLE